MQRLRRKRVSNACKFERLVSLPNLKAMELTCSILRRAGLPTQRGGDPVSLSTFSLHRSDSKCIRENKAHDEGSSHFVATSSTGEAVGTVRIHNSTGQVTHSCLYAMTFAHNQLGRLAVLPPFRGSGLARALCEAAHATAKAHGLKEVTADSQVSITPRHLP